MRQIVQRLANSAGYRIEKIRPQMPGPHIKTSDLVIFFLNKMRSGEVTFIQIGAHDGQYEDPLYRWIINNNWRGVLIEPQPKLISSLKNLHKDRPNIAIEAAVVSTKRGKETLWSLGDLPDLPKDAMVFAGLDYDTVRRNVRQFMPRYADRLAPTEVEAYSLSDIVEKHNLERVDLIQIDAEGFDYQIIKMIDFEKIKPLVINFEHGNMSPDERIDCQAYLGSQGYSMSSTFLGDTVACKESVLSEV